MLAESLDAWLATISLLVLCYEWIVLLWSYAYGSLDWSDILPSKAESVHKRLLPFSLRELGPAACLIACYRYFPYESSAIRKLRGLWVHKDAAWNHMEFPPFSLELSANVCNGQTPVAAEKVMSFVSCTVKPLQHWTLHEQQFCVVCTCMSAYVFQSDSAKMVTVRGL